MHKVLPNFMFIFFVAQSNQLQNPPQKRASSSGNLYARSPKIVTLKSSKHTYYHACLLGAIIFLPVFFHSISFDSGKNNNLETVVKSFKLILTDREHKIDRKR